MIPQDKNIKIDGEALELRIFYQIPTLNPGLGLRL